jgi:hypothetical protein
MLTVIFSVFAFCFVLERVVPGWRLPKSRTWPLRVLAINACSSSKDERAPNGALIDAGKRDQLARRRLATKATNPRPPSISA